MTLTDRVLALIAANLDDRIKARAIISTVAEDPEIVLAIRRAQWRQEKRERAQVRFLETFQEGDSVSYTEKDLSIQNTESLSKKLSKNYSESFLRFWAIYPRKVGKGAAWASWQRQRPDFDAIAAALDWQTKSHDWLKNGGQYIPNPATYLNQRRWEDERPAQRPIYSDRELRGIQATQQWLDMHGGGEDAD